MADAYKGLTVRIGADDTKLQESLATIGKAARNTQSELKRLGDALKSDPSSIRLMQANVELLGEKATEAATSMSLMQRALASVDSRVLGAADNHLADAAINAKDATARLIDMNAAIKATKDQLAGAEATIDAIKSKIVLSSKGKDAKFGIISNDQLENLKRARSEVVRLSAHLSDLRAQREDLQRSKDYFDQVEQVRSARIAVESYRAEIKKLAADMVDMRAKSDFMSMMSERFRTSSEEADQLARAISRSEANIRSIDAALSKTPGDMNLLRIRSAEFGDVISGIDRQLSNVRARINELAKTDGIESVSVDAKELGLMLERTNARCVELRASITEAEGEARALRERGDEYTKQMNMGKLAVDAYNAAMAGLDDMILKADLRVLDLKADLERAIGEFTTQTAVMELRNLVTEEDLLISKRRELTGWTPPKSEIAVYREQMDSVRSLRVETERYVETLRRTASEFVSLSSKTDYMDAMGAAFRESVAQSERLGAAIDEVETRLRSVDSALSKAPNDVKLTAERAKLFAEVVGHVDDEIEELSKQMSLIRTNPGFEELSMDSVELSVSIRKATSEAEELRASVLSVHDRIKQLGDEEIGLKEDFAKSRIDADAYERSLADIGDRFRELRKEADSAEEALESAMRPLNNLRANAQLREAETRISLLEAKERSLTTTNRALAGSFLSLGISMTSTITPAVLMAAHGIVQYAEDVDSAYRDMRKTVNGTEEEFERLRESAYSYSLDHPVSAETLLSIEALGGQMGIALDALEDFAMVVANLDIATDINAEEASKQLGQLANIMGMVPSDFERFGDSLVRLGNNMPTVESDIMNITSRIGSMASLVGFTYDEVLAWSAALASTGQGAESAGTALSKTFSQINTAVSGGTESVMDFATVAGMSAKDFIGLWQDDASSAFLEFVDGLASQGAAADATLISLGITGVRQKQALLGLANSIDNVRNALRMSKDAAAGIDDEWGFAGDAAREAANKAEGFSGALQLMRDSAMVLASRVGDTLTPVVKKLGVLVADIADGFGHMSDGMQMVSIASAGLVGATGPVLTSLSSMQSGINKWADNVNNGTSKISAKLIGYDKAAKIASGTTKLLSGAMGLMVGADIVAGLISVVSLIKGMSDAARDARIAADETTASWAESARSLETSTSAAMSNIQRLEQTLASPGGATQEGVLDIYKALIGDEAKLEMDLRDAEDTVERAKAKVEELREEWLELGDKYISTGDMRGQAKYVGEAKRAYDDAAHALEEDVSAVDDATAALEKNRESQAKAIDFMETRTKQSAAVAKAEHYLAGRTEMTAEEYAALGFTVENTGYTLDDMNRAIADNAAIMSLAADTIESEELQSLYELADGSELLTVALTANNISIEEFASRLESAGYTVGSFNEYVSNLSASIMNFWTAVGWNQENTIEAMVTNLADSQRALEVWTSDVQWMYDTLGKNAFTDKLFAGGIAENGYLLNQLHMAYIEAGGDLDAYIESLGMSLNEWLAIYDAYNQNVETLAVQQVEAVGSAAEEEAAATGEGIDAGIAAGVEDNASVVSDSLTKMVFDSLGVTRETIDIEAPTVGEYLIAGMAAGMGDATVVKDAARRAIDEAIWAAEDEAGIASPSKAFAEIGRYMSQGLAVGIGDDADVASRAARDMADVAQRAAWMSARTMSRPMVVSGGLTRSDLMDAVSNVNVRDRQELAVYIDGRQLTSAIAGRMDARLGTIAARRER